MRVYESLLSNQREEVVMAALNGETAGSMIMKVTPASTQLSVPLLPGVIGQILSWYAHTFLLSHSCVFCVCLGE